ncbi:hypothetical protein PGTUg99_021224 [Puccinia graminis f. sp. tritici]|uniref:Uncharacterized protein n=1 Tax=Puccinia graminis f. sp. tritici TaxID=56615 RepID=A0A5B0NJN6_PUCGR|nr:hypothetical protein PGTUg99_021224 [Puccinia graminis f. sp. tritici]
MNHVGVNFQPGRLLPGLSSGFSSRSIIAARSQATSHMEAVWQSRRIFGLST